MRNSKVKKRLEEVKKELKNSSKRASFISPPLKDPKTKKEIKASVEPVEVKIDPLTFARLELFLEVNYSNHHLYRNFTVGKLIMELGYFFDEVGCELEKERDFIGYLNSRSWVYQDYTPGKMPVKELLRIFREYKRYRSPSGLYCFLDEYKTLFLVFLISNIIFGVGVLLLLYFGLFNPFA